MVWLHVFTFIFALIGLRGNKLIFVYLMPALVWNWIGACRSLSYIFDSICQFDHYWSGIQFSCQCRLEKSMLKFQFFAQSIICLVHYPPQSLLLPFDAEKLQVGWTLLNHPLETASTICCVKMFFTFLCKFVLCLL